MKKNLLKRIGAVALAVAVSLTMGTAAFAAEDPATLNGVTGSSSAPAGSSVNIAKSILMINPDSSKVFEPNITYTYSISAATVADGKTITDSDNVTATAHSGKAAAIDRENSTLSVAYSDANIVDSSASGTADTKAFKVAFKPAEFGVPGVYRYKISESVADGARANAGVESKDTYAPDRYLDVYVHKDANGALEIYGYALFEAASANVDITKDTAKSNGYVNTATGTSAPADVDVYETYNLDVNKATTGNMADVNHQFAFSIALSGAPSAFAKAIVPNLASSENTTLVSGFSDLADTTGYSKYVAFTSGAATPAVTMANEGKVEINGIPKNAKVVVTETNNSDDIYKVKAGTEATKSDLFAEAAKAKNETAATAEQAFSANVNVFFTNTLEEISPTNVVMRFAPYLFILGAAIVLLVLMRRRKAHNAE